MPVAPPRPKGPHLNALRAFEAASRLGGFRAAAEELCVTPGAVSQHVKALEDWAGAALFERRSQGVALTPLGEAVAADFRAAFDALGEAKRRLRAHAAQKNISIAALPAVAQLWLAPRMPGIRAALPECVISITAMETPPNLRREPFDLSLFLQAPTGGKAERVLAEDALFPVCAAELAARLRAPEDLSAATILRDSTWEADWAVWARAAGAGAAVSPSGPVFSLYSLAVDEARAGAGVLIGHAPLVRRLLQSGELVAPFAAKVATGQALVMELARPASAMAARVADLLSG